MRISWNFLFLYVLPILQHKYLKRLVRFIIIKVVFDGLLGSAGSGAPLGLLIVFNINLDIGIRLLLVLATLGREHVVIRIVRVLLGLLLR